MPTPHRPSLAARRALQKLGADIRDARRRRQLPAAIVADRAFTSRPTLARVESGDHRVSIGIYAGILNALGLLDGLSSLADPAHDPVGMTLASEKLPTRVHLPKRRKSSDDR
jgi:transcriptional regulator with XRE-family HTH domain